MIKVCVNCVMDISDPGISFDKHGLCDHCQNFYKNILPNWEVENEGELNSLVAKIKKAGKNHDFDCIIGMSGGIDSSYLTYFVKEKMGLRPLVFHVDGGWNSKEAVNNIEKIVDKLDLDLYTEVINWEEMKDLQLAFFKSGVPHLDVPQDHAFFATMYKFARKYNIKYILTGGNLSTECIRNPVEWMYYQSDSVQLIDIHRKFGQKPLATFPITNVLWHKFYLPLFFGIKIIRPLDKIRYIKEEAVELLIEKFGWQPYPQKHFESRFTKFYEGYWLPSRFGFDTRKVQYSSLILTNQMSRKDALSMLEKPPFDEKNIKHDITYVATKLGISANELESYMYIPKKYHRDYKSQRSLYFLGAKLLKFLGFEIGGKR